MKSRDHFLMNEYDYSDRRWSFEITIGIVFAVVLCWPTWPGYMSFDSLFAYKQSIGGIETAVWPPFQAYLFWLSRNLGMDVWGYFLMQTALLTVSSFVLIGFFLKDVRARVPAMALFIAMLVIMPGFWGTIAVLWKDVTTTSFALLGVVAWLTAVRNRSYGWLVGVVLAYMITIALRYNAIPLIFFLLALFVSYPFGISSTVKSRCIAAFLAFSCVIGAYAAVTYRLPDFEKLPPNRGFAGIQEFDIVGVSVCTRKNLLPAEMTNGVSISIEQLTEMYDPRHVHITMSSRGGKFPQIIETEGDGAVSRAWVSGVTDNFLCFLWHRGNVFRELMGLNSGPMFYPTHGTIDENDYGIALANPNLSKRFNNFIITSANVYVFHPFWLYIIALITTLVTLRSNMVGRLPRVALLAGSYAYPAALFFVAPAADARYIFPSSIFCAILICSNIGLLLQQFLHRQLQTTRGKHRSLNSP